MLLILYHHATKDNNDDNDKFGDSGDGRGHPLLIQHRMIRRWKENDDREGVRMVVDNDITIKLEA
jgi:hypothetical protein